MYTVPSHKANAIVSPSGEMAAALAFNGNGRLARCRRKLASHNRTVLSSPHVTK